jgi:sodium pump decarboxylase gamma subunit
MAYILFRICKKKTPGQSDWKIFEKAALNTLMGMGTVFAVLILIAFIISLFKYIPKFQEMFAKKKNTAPAAATAPAAKAAPVVEEELVDDSELVAVIMAAIYASMASEGKAVSKDGLVVRSIRRSRR